MQLYIANVTKQHHQFTYRDPTEKDPQKRAQRMEEIPYGAQKLIGSPRLTHEQVQDIIKQAEPYGLISVAELKNARNFVGLCYSIDKPVQLDTFFERYEVNDAALEKGADDRRQTVAEAVANHAAQIGQEAGLKLQRAEIETQTAEEDPGTPSIAKGTEVTAEGVEPNRAGKFKQR